jgi:hypothetical protein
MHVTTSTAQHIRMMMMMDNTHAMTIGPPPEVRWYSTATAYRTATGGGVVWLCGNITSHHIHR